MADALNLKQEFWGGSKEVPIALNNRLACWDRSIEQPSFLLLEPVSDPRADHIVAPFFFTKSLFF